MSLGFMWSTSAAMEAYSSATATGWSPEIMTAVGVDQMKQSDAGQALIANTTNTPTNLSELPAAAGPSTSPASPDTSNQPVTNSGMSRNKKILIGVGAGTAALLAIGAVVIATRNRKRR